MYNIFNDKQGTILIMTLLILSSALIVVLVAANLVLVGIKMSGTQERSTIAYFASEAGAERILWEIRKKGFDGSVSCSNDDCIKFIGYAGINGCDSTCSDVDTVVAFSNGASYQVKYSDDGSTVTYTSYGSFQRVKRVVGISYDY